MLRILTWTHSRQDHKEWREPEACKNVAKMMQKGAKLGCTVHYLGQGLALAFQQRLELIVEQQENCQLELELIVEQQALQIVSWD